MNETVSIRKSSSGVMVNVTQKDGSNAVHWQERVTLSALVMKGSELHIPRAIRLCRTKCAMLWQGIADAEEE